MKKIIFVLLFCITSYAQNKLIGKFELKSSYAVKVDDFIISDYKLDLNIDSNDNFIMNSESIGGCTIVDRQRLYGVCKYKKDTLILVSPLPEKYIIKISDSILGTNKFRFSIRHFSSAEINAYLPQLKFFFIDKEMNQKKAIPTEIKTKFNQNDTSSQNNINELIVTFIIPEQTLYFKLQDKSNQNNVSLNILDIQNKDFTLTKNFQNLENKYNSITDEVYIDLTLNKYLIKKKGTKLKAVNKKQPYGSNLFQNKK